MALPSTQNSPTVRSRVVNRQVANTAQFETDETSDALGSISSAFDRFAGRQAQEELREEVEKDKDALAKLEVDVLSRPDEAREAVRSGDYSKFIAVERSRRRAIVTGAPMVIGQALGTNAARDFQDNILPKLGLETDGRQASIDYLQEQTKGMSPRAALKFKDSFQAGVESRLNHRRDGQEKLAAQQLEAKASVALRDGIANGSMGDIEDINELVRTLSAASPGGSVVENFQRLRAEADEVIITMSASPDPAVQNRAEKLLMAKDPTTGLSVYDRIEAQSPGAIVRMQEAAQKAFLGARPIQAQALKDDFLNRATEINAGVANPADLRKLAREFRTRAEAIGWKGAEMNQTYRTILGMASSQTKGLALWEDVVAKRGRVSLTPSDLDKVAAIGGMDDPNVLQAVAYNGLTPRMETMLSQGLYTGSSQEFVAASTKVRQLMNISKNGAWSFLKDPHALAVFVATDGAPPAEAMEFRADLRERLKAREGGKFKGAFGDKRPDFVGVDSTAATVGAKGYPAFFSQVFGSSEAKEAGLGELKFDDLSDDLKIRAEMLVDVATVAAGDEGSLQTIKSYFLKMFKDDVEFGVVGIGGSKKQHSRHTPVNVTTALGAIARGGKITEESADRFLEEAAEAGIDAGYRTDEQTRTDGTVLVTLAVNGKMDAVRLVPGESFMPEGMMHENFLGSTFVSSSVLAGEERELTGMVRLNVPVPGPQADGTVVPKTVRVNETTVMKWVDKNHWWEMRRAVGADLKALRDIEDPENLRKAVAGLGVTQEDLQHVANEANDLASPMLEAVQRVEARYGKQTVAEMHKEMRRIANALASPKFTKEEKEEAAVVANDLQTAIRLRMDEASAPRPVTREDVVKLLEDDDPRTKTMAELQNLLRETAQRGVPKHSKERRAIVDAMVARSKGVHPLTATSVIPKLAPAGTARALDDLSSGQREVYNRAQREAISKHIREGVADGSFSYEAIAKTKDASSIEEAEEIAERVTRRLGGVRDTTPSDSELIAGKPVGFMGEIVDFIAESEGTVPVPKKDLRANQMNLGHGFSLSRPDAPAALKAAGVSQDVLDGKKDLTKTQARIMATFAVANQEKWIRKHFKGVDMPRNVRKALHSFVYSSRWKKIPAGYDSPTIVTSALTQAIREERWADAANIVRHHLGVDPVKDAHIVRGMIARRNREAAMMEGFE